MKLKKLIKKLKKYEVNGQYDLLNLKIFTDGSGTLEQGGDEDIEVFYFKDIDTLLKEINK